MGFGWAIPARTVSLAGFCKVSNAVDVELCHWTGPVRDLEKGDSAAILVRLGVRVLGQELSRRYVVGAVFDGAESS